MTDNFQCPGCQQRYAFKPALAGKPVKCKKCGTTFRAPADRSAQAGAIQKPGADQVRAKPTTAAAQTLGPASGPETTKGGGKATNPVQSAPPPANSLDDLFDAEFDSLGSGASLAPISQQSPAAFTSLPRSSHPGVGGLDLSSNDKKILRAACSMAFLGIGAFVLPIVGLEFRALRHVGAALPVLAALLGVLGAGLSFYGLRSKPLVGGASAAGIIVALGVAYLISPVNARPSGRGAYTPRETSAAVSMVEEQASTPPSSEARTYSAGVALGETQTSHAADGVDYEEHAAAVYAKAMSKLNEQPLIGRFGNGKMVVLYIMDVKGLDVGRALRPALAKLSEPGIRHGFTGASEGGEAFYALAPVGDVDGASHKIDFGRVVHVDAERRMIMVVADRDKFPQKETGNAQLPTPISPGPESQNTKRGFIVGPRVNADQP